MPHTFLDSSRPDLEGKIAPESIELTDFEISSFFGPICQDCWQAFLIWISTAPVLLLDLERLYESYGIRPWGRSTFPGASPPAGPPKTRNIAVAFTFSKILSILEIEATLQHKNWTAKRDVLNFSYGPSNAPWSEIILNRATMQNEFMDHEKSSKNRSEVIPPTCFLDIPFESKFPLHLYYS